MDRYVPDYRVEINDEPLPAALRGCVTGISYQNGLEGADRVELSIANPDLRWLDHPLTNLDNPFELSLGYAPDPLEKVFVGEITGVNANFPNGGMPTLTVVAHDFMQRLTTPAKQRAFYIATPTTSHQPLPDPIVVSMVSLLGGLIPAIDPAGAALSFLFFLTSFAADLAEVKESIRRQNYETDFDFLTRIAREDGWELFIDHTIAPKGYILRFQFPLQDYLPSLVLKWGESLLDYAPRITNVGQIAGVSARIWLPGLQVELVLVLGWNYDRDAFEIMVYPGLGQLADILPAEQAQGVKTISVLGPVSAPREILSELLPRLNNRLTGSGSTIGDLRIRAGRVIQLQGLGKEFSGLYRITSATHSLDSGGFRTSFETRKEVWFRAADRALGLNG
jgi:uncharacterized protein